MIRIIINSGKGGVGKTTIAVAIARELSKSGIKVGLLDADSCPNIPEIMGIKEREIKLSDKGILPYISGDIEVMSLGLVVDTDIAILWKGDRRIMAIEQFMNHVDWTCDILIIDSPPGTSDEIVSLITTFEPDGLLIVTTNHEASISDVKRTIAMINVLKANDKLIGIINNMTNIVCPSCGEEIKLFDGGIDKEITSLIIASIPYVGVPLVVDPLRKYQYTQDEKDSIIGECLSPVVDKILEMM